MKKGKLLLVMCIICTLLCTKQVSAEKYLYDDLNRLSGIIYDDGSRVTYEYDKNGNILDIKVENNEPVTPAPTVAPTAMPTVTPVPTPAPTMSSTAIPTTPPKEKPSGIAKVLEDISTGIAKVFNEIANFFKSLFRW